MSQDRMIQALSAELDAARSAAEFEGRRAQSAEDRCKQLSQELERVQAQLRSALSASPASGPVPSGELAQRLRLALDSNQRLERARGKREREVNELRSQLEESRELARRWEQRARALEGRLKLLG